MGWCVSSINDIKMGSEKCGKCGCGAGKRELVKWEWEEDESPAQGNFIVT